MKKPASRPAIFDARPIIAAGESPFDEVSATLAALMAGESLVLLTPFLPSPLIERMQAEGFSARPERRADGAWQTRFTRR